MGFLIVKSLLIPQTSFVKNLCMWSLIKNDLFLFYVPFTASRYPLHQAYHSFHRSFLLWKERSQCAYRSDKQMDWCFFCNNWKHWWVDVCLIMWLHDSAFTHLTYIAVHLFFSKSFIIVNKRDKEFVQYFQFSKIFERIQLFYITFTDDETWVVHCVL